MDFPKKVDVLVVGAGFAGAVMAERLATQYGKRSLIVEKRAHIAGNAYDSFDQAGVLIHNYGPHYFRSNSDKVVDYLSHFTNWHPVEYKILSFTHNQYWQFPINLNTFEQLLGKKASSEEMEKTLNEWRVPIVSPQNSEEMIVSQVGWKLYEMFFKNYTRKQWKRDPKELDASVCGRIPIRTNRDDRYLSEKFQALPEKGYTKMFENILSHDLIHLALNVDYREVRNQIEYEHLVYTGPVDEYFDQCYGRLPYRSLRFEPETIEKEFYQPAMQVNYPNEHEFTRICEIKHATGQKLPRTTIIREYPQDDAPGREPYYPVPAPDARRQYEKYKALADREKREKKVSFVGRLATYRYYNMDQIVGMALHEAEKLGESFEK